MKNLQQCVYEYPLKEDTKYGQVPNPCRNKNVVMATAAGDGMTDFRIHNEDTLFIELGKTPNPGDIVFVCPSAGETPIIRQILVDEARGTFCLHASGIEPREEIYCTEPIVYGVVLSSFSLLHSA